MKKFACLFLMILSPLAIGELKVLGEKGTVTTLPATVEQIKGKGEHLGFTSQLSAHHLEDKKTNIPSWIPPFFVVGSDEFSIRWLEHHLALFREEKAIGFLIDKRNDALTQTLQEKTGLIIINSKLDELLMSQGITSYPAFFKRGVVNQ